MTSRGFDLLTKNHASKNGCRAPYLNVDGAFPICNTDKQIKESKMFYGTVKTISFPKPCHRISKIRYDYEIEFPETGELRIDITYPEELKIITQSKEVNIHSLIGNSGGYLGLFLGNF